MLYIVRFFTLLFIFSSCFVISAQNIVTSGLIIIFDVTIFIILFFFKSTKAVVKDFNRIGVETFKNNYKKSNLYISKNYVSAMYFDDVERKIHFLSSRKCITKFCYLDLVEAEFIKNTLFLYFTGDTRRGVPFYYKKEDFDQLNSMIGVLFNRG